MTAKPTNFYLNEKNLIQAIKIMVLQLLPQPTRFSQLLCESLTLKHITKSGISLPCAFILLVQQSCQSNTHAMYCQRKGVHWQSKKKSKSAFYWTYKQISGIQVLLFKYFFQIPVIYSLLFSNTDKIAELPIEKLFHIFFILLCKILQRELNQSPSVCMPRNKHCFCLHHF